MFIDSLHPNMEGAVRGWGSRVFGVISPPSSNKEENTMVCESSCSGEKSIGVVHK